MWERGAGAINSQGFASSEDGILGTLRKSAKGHKDDDALAAESEDRGSHGELEAGTEEQQSRRRRLRP